MIIKVPDNWNGVTIGQFQEITLLQDDKNKSLEIISILIDKDIEEIRLYDMASLNRVVEALAWTNELPSDEFEKTFTIDSIEYNMVKLSSLSVGEWIDLEGYLEKPIDNLHKIIGLFYRDNNLPYDTETAEHRSIIFKEKINVGQVYGTIVFFCNIEKNCMLTIPAYFQVEMLKTKLKNLKVNQKKKPGFWKRLMKKSGFGTTTYTA